MILFIQLVWSNLNLDLSISQARAFASGGILKDKRENDRGNHFNSSFAFNFVCILNQLSIHPSFFVRFKAFTSIATSETSCILIMPTAAQNQSVHFFEGSTDQSQCKGPCTQAIFVAATQCNSMQFLSRRSCNQLRFHCDFSAICQCKRQYTSIA